MKTLFIILSLSLYGDAASSTAKAEEKRADEWRKLQRAVEHANAAKQAFEAVWRQECASKGLQLGMKPSGDPGCIEQKKTQQENHQ